VVIVGGGAIGLMLAARFARAGIPVVIVTRTASQADALRQQGLSVMGVDGSWSVSVPATADPGALAHADWIIVAVKSPALPGLLPALRHYPAPTSRVAVVANGLDAYEAVPRALDPARVWAVLAGFGAIRRSPVAVVEGGLGPTVVGPLGASEGLAGHELSTLLAAAGLDAVAVADPLPHIWRKLAANAAINPLATVLRRENGALLEPPYRGLVRRVVREVAAVAQASGIAVGSDLIPHVELIIARTRHNRCSMLQDVEQGRPTELDAITGAIIRRAETLSVPVPLNRRLYRLVRRLTAR
jgi:2-dehydropantoate 2-reductase